MTIHRLDRRESQSTRTLITSSGGKLHQTHVEFLDWAERYDTGGMEMRSRTLHEAWLARLPGAVLRLETNRPVADQLAEIESVVKGGLLARRFRPITESAG